MYQRQYSKQPRIATIILVAILIIVAFVFGHALGQDSADCGPVLELVDYEGDKRRVF